MKKTIAVFWSGGKDAAMVLHLLQQSDEFEPKLLICTINPESNKVAMHGVPESLIDLQATSIGIPLLKMYLPEYPDNTTYETKFIACLSEIKGQGINYVAFGDIFLKDIKKYRENLVCKANMDSIFPLWGRNTNSLIEEFVSLEFRAVTCCINADILSDDFLGKQIDKYFIEELPQNVDPCGENGEFHSFCFDGPIFREPIQIKIENKGIREHTASHVFSYVDFEVIPSKQ